MRTETIMVNKKEYKDLKLKAEQSEELLMKLIKGLEDIKAGRTKIWKRTTSQ